MILVQKKMFGAAIVVALSSGALRPAQAVVLEQKFQAGQSAAYDATLSGTLTLNASEQTPVPWAGLPLSVPLEGNGQVAFDTLSTDFGGGATVAVRVPTANVMATVFGMNVLLNAKNGVGSFTLNGAAPKNVPLDFLNNPTYAMQVSRLGRIQGITPIAKNATAKNATAKSAIAKSAIAKSAIAKNAVSSTRSAASIVKIRDDRADKSDFLQKMLAMMPDFWPDRDVKVGDTWAINAKLPVANAPGGTLDLGALNFKLIGEESMSGGALQHISVNGTLTIDADKAAILNASRPKNDASKGTMQIVSDSKSVIGDLWFDANAGRLARATLKIAATSSLSGTTKADAQGKTSAWNSTQGFNGTFGMQFKGVSAAPVQASAKAPQKTS